MKENNLSFVSENLVVDYISFKFQDLEDWKEKELASYLLKLGFNCYKESGKLRKPIKTPIFMGLKNIHEACFVVDNPYWQGTVVTFSGLCAKLRLRKRSFGVYNLSTSYLSSEGFSRISKKI